MDIAGTIAAQKHTISQDRDRLHLATATGHENTGMTRDQFIAFIDAESDRISRAWDSLIVFETNMGAQGLI
jgi:hypothetical protein